MTGSSGRAARIIRAPNHLGDVVLALPALVAESDPVLVLRGLAPILRMALEDERVIPFERGFEGWRAAVGTLRRGRFGSATLMTPSFSAAWMMRWGGVSHLRGTSTDGRSLLLRDRIDPAELRPLHRINQYRLLLGQRVDRQPRSHRLQVPAELLARWREELRGDERRLVGLFPGANAPARRWPARGFVELARARTEQGDRVVVLGGPGEAALTAEVAAAAPGVLDLGGRTGIDDLAAVLAVLDVLVTNDTGPMHLAGSVGTPTVSLWGSSDPDEVRQTGAPDFGVTGPDLPCKPCYRNHCRRKGAGTLLAEAHEECMKLISVDQVRAATQRALTETAP